MAPSDAVLDVLADQAAEDRPPLDGAEISKIGNRSGDRGFEIRRLLASRLMWTVASTACACPVLGRSRCPSRVNWLPARNPRAPAGVAGGGRYPEDP